MRVMRAVLWPKHFYLVLIQSLADDHTPEGFPQILMTACQLTWSDSFAV